MLTKCTAVDAQRALDYIGSDRLLCFYMYMDIIECGVESEGLGLWISETNDNITIVCIFSAEKSALSMKCCT